MSAVLRSIDRLVTSLSCTAIVGTFPHVQQVAAAVPACCLAHHSLQIRFARQRPSRGRTRDKPTISAFDEDNVLGQFMEARQAGKQFSEAQEAVLVQRMLARANAVAENREHFEDRSAVSRDHVQKQAPVPAAGDVADQEQTPEDLQRQPSQRSANPSAQHSPASSTSSVWSDNPRTAGRKSLSPGHIQNDTARFTPRKRELTDDELRQELILRSLSYEVNAALSTPQARASMTSGVAEFMEADVAQAWTSGHGSAPAQARQQDLTYGTQLLRLGIVGIPNAGKSTLTNYLAGGTVSAVSARPETTRAAALGAFVSGSTQVVMYDTPGMKGAKDYETRGHAMRVASAWTHVQECDLLALIVDSEKQTGRFRTPHVDELAKVLGSEHGPPGYSGAWQRVPSILLLNKVDLISRSRRKQARDLAMELGELCPFDRVFFISARLGLGMNDVREYLISQARPAEWAFEAGAPTDLSWSELAAELVREKLYWTHAHELPYKLVPQCTSIKELADGKINVEVELLVRTQNMKKMVTGADGERAARIEGRVGAELARMMRRYVQVSMKVRVRKDAVLPEIER